MPEFLEAPFLRDNSKEILKSAFKWYFAAMSFEMFNGIINFMLLPAVLRYSQLKVMSVS